MGQRFAGALAGHLHQSELGEARHAHLGVVLGERLAELVEHRVAMFDAFHVDEVDDDDAAEIAQAQLARDGLGGLEVGLEDGVVEVAGADEAAGVHVHRGHGLGLVHDEVTAGLQIDPPRQRLLDLVLDPVEVEQRALADIVGEQWQHLGHVLFGKGGELLEVLSRVDLDAAGFVAHQIAQHALAEGQVLVQHLGRKGPTVRLRISAQILRK